MPVDIGAEAIDRASHLTAAGRTTVNKDGPAAGSGTITSVEIWAYQDLSSVVVGTFYTTNGNTLKCRASEAIGAVTAGAKRTFPVSIAVVAGDYIGIYHYGGYIERDSTGFAGVWQVNGQYIDPGDETEYSFIAQLVQSLGGYIGAAAVGRSFGFIFG